MEIGCDPKKHGLPPSKMRINRYLYKEKQKCWADSQDCWFASHPFCFKTIFKKPMFEYMFDALNLWRILSLLFFVIVCYCFFYNWNLVFGDYWHQPGCLPGEGIRSRALVLPGGQGENRWRMVGDLHGPEMDDWNMKHGVYLHLLYNLPWMHWMPWMPWKNGRHRRSHCRCEADDEDDAQEADEEEDEAGFPHPKMAVDGWHSGVAT